MPTKTVTTLVKAVEDLHDAVLVMKTDMRWVKNGMIGLYSVVGVAIITALVEAFIK